MQKAEDIRTGIEIWEGAPGSGKSYGAVDALIRMILDERRPVYTNLPLKLKVLRAYLKRKSGSATRANYIRRITRGHFERFVERNQLLSDFREECQTLGWSEGKIEREFVRNEGQHVVQRVGDVDANWLPPGSVLIFDEFHRWADQRTQKDESPAFLSYATMHRHHMHLIMLLTQDKMQISLPWRRNAVRVIRCIDQRQLPFAFGLKLPIPVFQYQEWPIEYADSKDHGNKKPSNSWARCPLFSGGLMWRFYDSFTHMGSRRQLYRRLESAREEVEGDQYENPQEYAAMKKPRIGAVLWPAAVCVLLVVMVIQNLPGCSLPTSPSDFVSAKPMEVPVAATQSASVAGPPVLPPPLPPVKVTPLEPSPVVTGVGKGYAVVSGRVVPVKAMVGEWTLVGVSNATGATLWENGDAIVNRPLGGVRPGRTTFGNPASPKYRKR